MKRYRALFMITMLVLASLACQALAGGGSTEAPPDSSSNDGGTVPTNVPTDAPPSSDSSNGNGGGGSSESAFPMTQDAYNILDIGDGTILYYTKMSLEDVMKFYRDEYTSRGYTEYELLTVVSDGVFSIVFEGDPSGKAVVIQSVDLGDGSRTVTIRLEDV